MVATRNCNLLHGLGSATRRGAAPPNPTTSSKRGTDARWHRTHRPPQCPVPPSRNSTREKKLASSVIMGRANNLDRHRMRLSVASVQCAFYSQAGSTTGRTPRTRALERTGRATDSVHPGRPTRRRRNARLLSFARLPPLWT